MAIEKIQDSKLKSTHNSLEVAIAVINGVLTKPPRTDEYYSSSYLGRVKEAITGVIKHYKPQSQSAVRITAVREVYSRFESTLLDKSYVSLQPKDMDKVQKLIAEFMDARGTYRGDKDLMAAVIDRVSVIDQLSAPLKPYLREDEPSIADWMTVSREELVRKTAPSLKSVIEARLQVLYGRQGILFTCQDRSVAVIAMGYPDVFYCFEPSSGTLCECTTHEEVARVLSPFFTSLTSPVETALFVERAAPYLPQAASKTPPFALPVRSYPVIRNNFINDNPSFLLSCWAACSAMCAFSIGCGLLAAGVTLVSPLFLTAAAGLLTTGIFSAARPTAIDNPSFVFQCWLAFSALSAYVIGVGLVAAGVSLLSPLAVGAGAAVVSSGFFATSWARSSRISEASRSEDQNTVVLGQLAVHA